MGSKSSIEWTDASWNPIIGCTRVSEGCKNCYAFAEHDRRHKGFIELGGIMRNGTPMAKQYAMPFGVLQLLPERITQPLSWMDSRRVFVNSLSDIYHEAVPDDYIDKMFAVMAMATRHTFQVLTKRPERMVQYFAGGARQRIEALIASGYPVMPKRLASQPRVLTWPLPNVWMGVTAENQKWVDRRAPLLTRTPAAVRFLSCEPLLEDIRVKGFGPTSIEETPERGPIHWLISGGESGFGKIRPFDAQWARSLRDQAAAEGMWYFFKQYGKLVNNPDPQDPTAKENGGPTKGGCTLDGRIWNEFPTPKVVA